MWDLPLKQECCLNPRAQVERAGKGTVACLGVPSAPHLGLPWASDCRPYPLAAGASGLGLLASCLLWGGQGGKLPHQLSNEAD